MSEIGEKGDRGDRGDKGDRGDRGLSKLAPSKSTVYVSNLDFGLTNNDLATIFEKYGKLAKVTVMKDRITRLSKGVAFVLFVRPEDAKIAAAELHNTVMNERTISCSIAKDNGRAREFIKKKLYTDKTRCYECGDMGHLSYKCPKNQLGERQQPIKKDKKRKRKPKNEGEEEDDGEYDREYKDEDFIDDIEDFQYVRQRLEGEFEGSSKSKSSDSSRKPMKSGYFSDEDADD